MAVLVAKRFSLTRKLAPVVVLLAMSVVVGVLGLESVATVGDIASIPNGLPAPMVPDLSIAPLVALGAISVAIVALVQGAGISTAYPNPSGAPASASRDFVGQGIGNVAASFFQSLPTGGSLSRTGISVSGGARSRWGGVFAALWLGALMLLFGNLAELVPLAVIAGLLFVIAAELVLGRLPSARLVYSTSITSTAAMLLTFVSAFFVPLQWTIFLGVGLCVVVYLVDSARAGRVVELTKSADGYWHEADAPAALEPGRVTVLGFRDWGHFAGAARLADKLPRPDAAAGSVVVARMREVTTLRSTGLIMLEHYRKQLEDAGAVLILAGVHEPVIDTLTRTGAAEALGADNIIPQRDGITASLDEAYERATRLVNEA